MQDNVFFCFVRLNNVLNRNIIVLIKHTVIVLVMNSLKKAIAAEKVFYSKCYPSKTACECSIKGLDLLKACI